MRHDSLFPRTTILVCLALAGCGQTESGTLGATGSGGGAGAEGGSGGFSGAKSTGGAGSLEPVRICDGSEGLRFAWSIAPGREGPPGLFYEHGGYFFLVSGTCDYFSYWQSEKSLHRAFSAVRTGKLTSAEEQELAAISHYAAWPAWDKRVFAQDVGGFFDYPVYVFSDGTHRFACRAPCTQDGPEVWATSELILTRFEEMYGRGTDLTGPMRLRVTQAESSMTRAIIDWPLSASLPLADLSLPINVNLAVWGPAHLVTDEQDLSVLRGLRLTIGFDPINQITIIYAKHPTPGMLYTFAFRDVVPFENERGFIPALYGNPGAEYP